MSRFTKSMRITDPCEVDNTVYVLVGQAQRDTRRVDINKHAKLVNVAIAGLADGGVLVTCIMEAN